MALSCRYLASDPLVFACRNLGMAASHPRFDGSLCFYDSGAVRAQVNGRILRATTSKWRSLRLLVCAQLMVIFVGLVAMNTPIYAQTTAKTPPLVRFERPIKAPEFSLVDLRGDQVRLSKFRGSHVLLNFWATWCPPCVKELPTLQAVHERFGENAFSVVGIAADAADACGSSGIR